jgi:hypothetical protein
MCPVLDSIATVGDVALEMSPSSCVEVAVLDRVTKHVEGAAEPVKRAYKRLHVISMVATGTVILVQALAHSNAKRNDANCRAGD